ncbi:MAG: IPT/TIG domain-containing protein [Acidobacteriota bacterium]
MRICSHSPRFLLINRLLGRPALLAALWCSCPLGSAQAADVPAGLPDHFAVGLAAHPDDTGIYGWMPATGVPWDYAYQYLCGGANTGSGWATWNSNAMFPLYYAQGCAARGYIPTFPYYQLLQSSGPCDSCAESRRDLANLNSPTVMRAYFEDFILLMKRLGPGTHNGVQGFGRTAIVHIEGDLAGYAQHAVLDPSGSCYGFCDGQGNDPSLLRAAVASSGVVDVAGFPNTFAGFNLALLHIRDLYAPNVLMAFHLSNWATRWDVGSSTDPGLDVAALGRQAGQFANLCGVARVGSGTTRYDLVFNDVADRDAGFYKYVYGRQDAFWDRYNAVLPNFHRWEAYVRGFVETTAKPVIVWQVPIGNQYFRSMNNTWGHYQDNRAEYFFGHVQELIDVGIIGLQFGCGNTGSTVQWDGEGDGTTNPAAVCTSDGVSTGQICNDRASTVVDDDGGYLRMAAAEYYRNPIPISSGENRRPAADAGEDQTVPAASDVLLDGSGSRDPDGDGITYGWQQISGTAVVLSGATTSDPTFAAPSTAASLLFRLTVSDGRLSDTDDVLVTVIPTGSAPFISTVKSRSGKPGSAAKVIGSGFGSDKRSVAVVFGGRSAKIKKVSPACIWITIPRRLKSHTTVDVYARVGGVSSNTVRFILK